MGGIGKALFGGSNQSASSGNVNNGAITGALNPAMGYVGQAGNLMSSLLGGNQTALNNFANSGGMQFLEDQGQKMVTSSMAAKGLLNSGGYGQALEQYGQNLGSTYLNQYLQDVNNLGQLGLGAAGVVSDAGKTSSETSSSKNGIIPGIAGLIRASHGG